MPNGGSPRHLLLSLGPDHVLIISGNDVALHTRWPPEDPPRIAGKKIADLSNDQVSALLWHLQHWGGEPRLNRGNGCDIFVDL